MFKTNNISTRKILLPIGIISMLFSGIIYAWSILKEPLAKEFGWGPEDLALNFTLTMTFFCIGGFLGSQITKKLGTQPTVIAAGLLTGLGFILTGFSTGNIFLLYITYALMSGLGIGISYNVIISTINAWFPDKKGVCSGCLMMGFGASTLILGKLSEKMFISENIGWRNTFIIIGIILGVILVISGIFIKRPDSTVQFPVSKVMGKKYTEAFETKDYSTKEMLCRASFWKTFLMLVLLTAVGSSVISFAKDLSVSVGTESDMATTLVGVLSIFNGLGRILTGALFDNLGRRKTMITANIITVFAATVILISVLTNSVFLCIAGLCLTGISYGSSPTTSAAVTSSFYGTKHYQTNFSVMNFNLIFASFIATLSSKIFVVSGGYTVPFILLTVFATIALVLSISIKKP